MDQDEPTDAELVARTLAGDCRAFGQLYDRHARLVRAVVGGVSLDWSQVEDMTQETFLRAYRNLGKLRDPHGFDRWLVGTARQVGRERRRSLRRDRHEFVGQRPLEVASTTVELHDLQLTEELAMLKRNVETLPDRERLAIHAFFLREQDARRAAELLELSRSGFYALLQRAVARLAAMTRSRDLEEETRT